MTAVTATVAELYHRIQSDRFRVENAFSDDIIKANNLLLNPAAFPDELQECTRLWCKDQQPCQFGRMAAADRRIHFCVLTDPAFTEWSDNDIAQAISESKRLWKQRAAYDPEHATHSFLLVLASTTLAYAAPDANLRAFSNRILELTGWTKDTHSRRRRNTISSDYLYLRNPNDNQFYGFQFNIDFFAAAGDKRWWHDHRFPGGIAFSANSTGHMRYYREWYRNADGKAAGEWAIRQAMKTVASAFPTAQFRKGGPGAGAATATSPAHEGRVTWLLELGENGQPFIQGIACPMPKLPADLANKDWTRYEGFLHTDHAVREEFFLEREAPETITKPYLMDFTYLYDTAQQDFIEFTSGRPVAEAEILAEIGDKASWAHRHARPSPERSAQDESKVAEQLAACETWTVPSAYLPLE